MILKEYRCRDCDTHFESSDADPVCPTCTSGDEERVFLTAPGFKQPATATADREIRNLANDYGLQSRDVNNRYGEPVKKVATGNPSSFGGNQQIMQNLSALGGAGDNFSQVLPSLRAKGSIRNWRREPIKK